MHWKTWWVALVVALFQVGGSFGAAQNQPNRHALDAVAVALLLAGPIALGVRDRWPVGAVAVSVAAAVFYLGLGYPYGPVVLSVVASVFSAVRAGHRVGTWAWMAAGFVGLVVGYGVSPRTTEEVGVTHFLVVAGWMGVLLAVSEIARIRTEQAAERARARVEERERREGEQRLHLAQELHDVLAHNISQINVQASVALHLLDEQPDAARPALTAIKQASRESLNELRTALDILRGREDAPRAPAPHLRDVEALVQSARASGLEVRLEGSLSGCSLPAAVEQAAFRIVQEALTNVWRHAGAGSVVVSVTCDGGLDLEVVDDGVGGEAAPGTGLTGMRRRAEAMGGTFEAGPVPGGGFRVAAHLPGGEP